MTEVTGRRPTANERSLDRAVRNRIRLAGVAGSMRTTGIQLVWLVVLTAGAAIPLTEAIIDDGWAWLSPTLGFVVVVAAGVERIFGRTTDAAVALDRLRRELARERRLMLACSGPYSAADGRFAAYAERTDDLIEKYDTAMVEYNMGVVRDAGKSAASP